MYLTDETMVFNGELDWKRKKEENRLGMNFPEPTVSHTANRRESGQLSRIKKSFTGRYGQYTVSQTANRIQPYG